MRHQIAQKLHAVTEQPEDRENFRFWDLIDLILLRELLDGDLASVRQACVTTFGTRGTHSWPPELVVRDSWAEPYTAAIEEIDNALPAAVEAAADAVRGFIAEIEPDRQGAGHRNEAGSIEHLVPETPGGPSRLAGPLSRYDE